MTTILGIGAHYDDCVFGISGLLLKALRKHHRVVVLSLIGDYRNWKPVQGRERELVEGTVRLGKEYGVEMRFLDFAEMKFDVTEADHARWWPSRSPTSSPTSPSRSGRTTSIRTTSWRRGSGKVALGFGDRLIDPGKPLKRPRRIYQFDNGPRHTIGFEPNTFVDVTDEWPLAMEWLGKLMALMRNQPFDKTQHSTARNAPRKRWRSIGARPVA